MAFYVGQKVVCVDECEDESCNALIKEGIIVTVANVYWCVDELVLELVEFPAPEDAESYPGWVASAFRPIVSRPTSISIFIAMLGPKAKERIDG